MTDKLKIKSNTIIRTIILALALVNQILQATGKSPLPVSDEALKEFLTLAFTIGASLWAWWKNNSFTQNALKADEYLDELRVEDAEDEH